MSYTIDVPGKMRAQPPRYSCFVGFFPQMVAGPIVRASMFLPQLQTLRKFPMLMSAALFFLTGFIKKPGVARPSIDRYFEAP
jgi:alginate O-acetyltransferase complex protein AlgI